MSTKVETAFVPGIAIGKVYSSKSGKCLRKPYKISIGQRGGFTESYVLYLTKSLNRGCCTLLEFKRWAQMGIQPVQDWPKET